MVKPQTSSKSFNGTAGAILISLGLLLLFSNLDEIAARAGNSFHSTGSSLSTVIQLGLAGMRAVQSYFFDQPTFQAGLHLILVSFWPVILVIIGAVLLQGAFRRQFMVRQASEGLTESEIAHE